MKNGGKEMETKEKEIKEAIEKVKVVIRVGKYLFFLLVVLLVFDVLMMLYRHNEQPKVERPKVETDYLGQCVWAYRSTESKMIKEVDDSEKDKHYLSYDFMFKCLEKYPNSLEGNCWSTVKKLDAEILECRKEKKPLEDKLKVLKDKCNRYCDNLKEHYKTEQYCGCE